jgi:hypothetical protein
MTGSCKSVCIGHRYHMLSLFLLDSSASVVTGYGLDGWGSIPGRGKRFFSTPQNPDKFWGPPGLLSNGYWGLFVLG